MTRSSSRRNCVKRCIFFLFITSGFTVPAFPLNGPLFAEPEYKLCVLWNQHGPIHWAPEEPKEAFPSLCPPSAALQGRAIALPLCDTRPPGDGPKGRWGWWQRADPGSRERSQPAPVGRALNPSLCCWSSGPVHPLPLPRCKCCESAWEPLAEQGPAALE